MKNINDYVIYIDTDSVTGDSVVNTNKGNIKIEDLWKDSIEKHEYKPGKYLGYLPGYTSASFNTKKEKIEFNKINFIMKHKVSKKMFKITIGDDSVVVTEDHSIIIKRNNRYISVKPNEILSSDILVKKDNNINNNFIIEDLGIQEIDVYDIEVAYNHNFFANNILVHNSLFLNVGKFIEDQGLKEYWDKLDEKSQIEYCKKIANRVETYVNINSYKRTQKEDLNSQIDDYKISFKSEMVASSGLWIAKKKYCLNIVDNEGVRPVDPLKVTGLEVVRSDTPIVIRDILKELMLNILQGVNIDIIMDKIEKAKDTLRKTLPEDISNNISCKNVLPYIAQAYGTGNNRAKTYDEMTIDEKTTPAKGAPWNIKAVLAYHKFLWKNKLESKYEEIKPGEKVKIVYLKTPNKWNFDAIAFDRWIPEFNENGLYVDYEKMIEKNLINKLETLLKPMGLDERLTPEYQVFNVLFGDI